MPNLDNSAGIVIQRVGAAVDPALYLGGARKI
jgi:hypothetical protein